MEQNSKKGIRLKKEQLHKPKGKFNMGDKSPKSVQKKAQQKQSKNDTSSQKKKQAMTDKQAGGKKK